MQVCSTSEKLLRWRKEPGPERSPHHQKPRGTVRWLEVERGRQEGASLSLGVRRGHLWAVNTLLPDRLGAGRSHGLSHLEMGKELVSVQK